MNPLKDRVIQLFKALNLNPHNASDILSIPQRTLNRQINENGKIGIELINSLLEKYDNISSQWLLQGEGSMFINKFCTNIDKNNIPYYCDIPVNAGKCGTYNVSSILPTGYINIPGLKAQFLFPIIGSSMEPEINQGDIIGLCPVESIEQIDENKIYMIITTESRMIKRCCKHETDYSLLCCISTNYPSFTISKKDIMALYEVTLKIEKI